jgi:cell division protein FtsL
MTNSDETMTRYLFGELSEAEQSRLEALYFNDAQTFEQLTQLETELVDAYARGRLSAQMRERFERAYLLNPNRRARVRFGEALAVKLDKIAASRVAGQSYMKGATWWQRLSSQLTGGRRVLAFSMASALLLLSFVSVWLFIRDSRLRQESARAHDAQTAQEQREREAEQQLASERARTKELNAELERTRTEPTLQPTPAAPQRPAPTVAAPVVATLVLMAGGVRGVDTGAPPTLVIHRGTQKVRLRLKLRDNEYQSYQLILQAVGGREVFNRSHFKPQTTKSGASLILSLPASKFGAGDYILTLKGVTPGGEVEDVSRSLFRVEEK